MDTTTIGTEVVELLSRISRQKLREQYITVVVFLAALIAVLRGVMIVALYLGKKEGLTPKFLAKFKLYSRRSNSSRAIRYLAKQQNICCLCEGTNKGRSKSTNINGTGDRDDGG